MIQNQVGDVIIWILMMLIMKAMTVIGKKCFMTQVVSHRVNWQHQVLHRLKHVPSALAASVT